MNRRQYLGLVTGGLAGIGGCTATAVPGTQRTDDRESLPDCPDLLDADRTVCPGAESGPLSVDRSREAVSGDDWSLRVTVTNLDGEPFGCNPYAWTVFRAVDDAWTRVGPDAHAEPWVELPPGDRYSWQLSAAGAAADGSDQRVFIDLEPGRHAFAVRLHGPETVAAVAPFAVDT